MLRQLRLEYEGAVYNFPPRKASAKKACCRWVAGRSSLVGINGIGWDGWIVSIRSCLDSGITAS